MFGLRHGQSLWLATGRPAFTLVLMTTKIVVSDADCSIAAYRNISIAVFTGQLRQHHMAPLLQMRDAQRKIYPEGLYTCVLVLPTGKLPAHAVRTALIDSMREHQSTQLGTAFVIESKSVNAVAMRTVISAVALSAKAQYRLFDELSNAVPWLAEACNSGKIKTTAQELERAVHDVAFRQQTSFKVPNGPRLSAAR